MVSYDENEVAVVETGIEAIRTVMFSQNITQIRKLLLCLDKYLDPYFQCRLLYEHEIFEVLQELVVSSQSDEVIADTLQLLGDYCTISLNFIETHFDQIKESMKPNVRDVLSMP